MTPDAELLRRFVETDSEGAFAELVERHLNLVYSAAFRQVNGDAHLAQDVAQCVFVDLARKAGTLSGRAALTGWLYRSTHYAAAKAVRAERRRRVREQEAHLMSESASEPAGEPEWTRLRPVIDAAMQDLREIDREAILLRFFENRPVADIARSLGLTENAARMRLERALERLRSRLVRRGLATTSAALSLSFSANAIQVAPAGLAAAVSTGSLAAAAVVTGTAINLLKIMTATQLKIGIGALTTAGLMTAFVMGHRAQMDLRAQNGALLQQLDGANAQNYELSQQIAASGQRSFGNQSNELLRLRAEVTRLNRSLSQASNALAAAAQAARPLESTNPAAEQQEERKRDMRRAKDLVWAAFYDYPDRHPGQFATNWSQLAGAFDRAERNSLNPGDPMPDTVADFRELTNEFEFVYKGPLENLYNATNFHDIVVLREAQPVQLPDGQVGMIYGFADGHSTLMAQPPEGFAAWEQEHKYQPAGN